MTASFSFRYPLWFAAWALLMAACSSPAPATDASVQTDTGGQAETGPTDTGPADSGDPCGGPAVGRCIPVRGVDDPPPTQCAEYPAARATEAANLCNNRSLPISAYIAGACSTDGIVGRCARTTQFCERTVYYAGTNVAAARSACEAAGGTWSQP